MTDSTPFTPPTSRKLVTKPIGPVDKRRRRRGLTVAVRTAIDALVYDRCTRAEACERAGIAERSLYLAFEKPEVAVYFNKALEVLRAGERPRNIHRLCEIREAANNMPAVNAIKALMQLDDENAMRSTNTPSPGVTIRIVNQVVSPAPIPVIDVTPQGELELEPELEPVQRFDPIFRVP